MVCEAHGFGPAFGPAQIHDQPGPGVDAASRRDLKVGFDMLNTLSQGAFHALEHGNFTLDRIEVRVYDAVPD